MAVDYQILSWQDYQQLYAEEDCWMLVFYEGDFLSLCFGVVDFQNLAVFVKDYHRL